MSLASKMGLAAGLAGAALVIYVQRRSQQTGRDVTQVLSNLPEELIQTKAVLEKRLKTALAIGKKAAAEKEAEIDHQLRSQENPAPPESPDYSF